MTLFELLHFGKRKSENQESKIFMERVSLQNNPKKLPKRPYKCIPLYTEDEMEDAKIDNSEEVLYQYIGRQALNGYAGLYKGEWVVGRNRAGEIVKTKEQLLFESIEQNVIERNKRIKYTQNHALYGKDLVGEVFCKFTYDIERNEDFAIHVDLVHNYKEFEIKEDEGTYGGLHFVPIEHLDICLNCINTYYGDKIALIEPIENEVYYEYMDNTFVGKKVYVSQIMKLCDVDTWRTLSKMTKCIISNKEKICVYLKGLQNMGYDNYEDCIEYLNKIG